MWLVFDIGCLECGEDSKPLGFYRTKAEADKAAQGYASGEEWGRPEWHGQHAIEVFDVTDMTRAWRKGADK